ncbi:MAG: hypothetical protein JRE72_01855 [Deltaproteobacteria bacterium]|jgi:hypothetical protein|nr:hypothetical protein [Deltaproteobacteria bacterium]
MEIFWDIAFHTVEILTLLFGILGMAFSLLLLFSPRLTKSLGNFFNRSVSLDPKINILDRDIPTEAFIYSHHIIIGICLVAGSIFALIFFFFNIDISNFAKVFLGSRKYFMTLEIVFIFFAWVARLACVVGLICGLFLLFAPAKMQAIEGKVNTWFETQAIFEKLDRTGLEVDALFFRHPFFFGMAGAIVSFLIITLSVANLLS